MPFQRIAGPRAEPLSLVEAKSHLKVVVPDDDSLIGAMISAARGVAETKTQRSIITQRWKLVLDAFPGLGLIGVPPGKPYGLPQQAIVIAKGPFLQVASIQYTDMGGTLQTLVVGTDYVVEGSSDPARITPPFGKIWPIPLPQIGAVVVTFDAGDATPMTPDSSTDTIYVPGWKTLSLNDPVRLSFRDKAAAGDGKLPTGLAANTDYYVQAIVSADKYKLSATPSGSVIDLTDNGGGDMFIGEIPQSLTAWMKLAITTLYDNRGSIAVGQRLTSVEMPSDFVEGLLDDLRIVVY